MRCLLALFFATALAAGLFLASCGDGRDSGLTDTAETARTVAAGFHVPDPERIPSDKATTPGKPWGDYVGSKACEECHQDEYVRWRGSFHSRTLYELTPDTAMGRFDGQPVIAGMEGKRFFEVTPFTWDDPQTGRTRYYVRIEWIPPEEGGVSDPAEAETYGAGELPDLSAGTYEVLYAFGNRRDQPYVARWPDGKHWVLPIHWNDEGWRYSGFRPYVRACGQCHVTGIKTSPTRYHPAQEPMSMTDPPVYNLPPGEEGWADGAVGCEHCHGPGRDHVVTARRMGAERYGEARAAGDIAATIFDGHSNISPKHRTDLCGQCHNFFTEHSCTWTPSPEGVPGDPLYEPLEPTPEGVGWQFYADGSHMSPCTVVAVYRETKMYAAGVGCNDCHDPHGTENWADLVAPIENNELCLRCHGEEFPDVEAEVAHSHHPAGARGNMCVECHMPRHLAFTNGVHVMSHRIYKHDFSIPTGVRAAGGPPSACNVCHTDRDHAWTREQIRRLWPGD